MRRNQIIFGSVLVLVLASFGGVYQFYFKEKLDQYAKDRQFRMDLETQASDLATFFSGTDPETVLSMWRNQVQPWAETLDSRAQYFDDGKWLDHETPPEAGRILPVWYGEQVDKMLADLYQKVYEKAPNISPFPENILTTLEIKSESDLSTEKDMTPERMRSQINQNLAKLAFASNLIDLLLDEKVIGINEITVWPRRQDRNHKGQLTLRTAGLDMYMYMRHVVHFLEYLRRQKRYFHVDAIHLSNPYIAEQAEPYMRVKLLLTQAVYTGESQADQAGAGSAKSLFNMTAPRAGAKPPLPIAKPEELTGFGKAWKWFKRNILYMN